MKAQTIIYFVCFEFTASISFGSYCSFTRVVMIIQSVLILVDGRLEKKNKNKK